MSTAGVDKLAHDAAAARAAGMTYGKWKAMHPTTEIREEPKRDEKELEKHKIWRKCVLCGKDFCIPIKNNRKYCSIACYDYVNNERSKKYQRQKRERERAERRTDNERKAGGEKDGN